MAALVAVEALAIALLGLLVLGMLRSHAEVLARLARMEGQTSTLGPAELVGVDSGGSPTTIPLVSNSKPQLLAFLSSTCITCHLFWEQLAASGSTSFVSNPEIVIVTQGQSREDPKRVAELAPKSMPVVMSDDAWKKFGVPGAPFFILLEAETSRQLVADTASDWLALQHLVADNVGRSRV